MEKENLKEDFDKFSNEKKEIIEYIFYHIFFNIENIKIENIPEENLLNYIIDNSFLLTKNYNLKNLKENLKELEKKNNSELINNFINNFINYWDYFLEKNEYKIFMKSYLAEKVCTYLKFNDYLAELDMYIKIIEDINILNIEVLMKKYNLKKFEKFKENLNFLKVLNEIELQSSPAFPVIDDSVISVLEYKNKIGDERNLTEDIFFELYKKYIESKFSFKNTYFAKNIFEENISYEKNEFSYNSTIEKIKNIEKNELRMKKYTKSYKQYEKFLYYKYAYIKIYLNTNSNECDYFKDFSISIKKYRDFLEKSLKESFGDNSYLLEAVESLKNLT